MEKKYRKNRELSLLNSKVIEFSNVVGKIFVIGVPSFA